MGVGNSGSRSPDPTALLPTLRLVYVELYKGAGRRPWRIRLVGGNGEILNISQGYATKWNAKRAARKVFPQLELNILP